MGKPEGVAVHTRIGESFSVVVVLVLAVALCVLLPVGAKAQIAGATLTGTVVDASGAVVPNVQILITNEATGEVRTVTVDSAGVYSAPNLLPGK